MPCPAGRERNRQPWSGGLTVTGHPEWPDVDFDRSGLHGGLASVIVARQERRQRVTVCGYLVDTYCLGPEKRCRTEVDGVR